MVLGCFSIRILKYTTCIFISPETETACQTIWEGKLFLELFGLEKKIWPCHYF